MTSILNAAVFCCYFIFWFYESVFCCYFIFWFYAAVFFLLFHLLVFYRAPIGAFVAYFIRFYLCDDERFSSL